MIGNAGEDVGEPCLWVDAVHFCRGDQAVHDRPALTTAIGAGEQPVAASQSQAPNGALRRVVGEANPPIIQEASEGGPAGKHVINHKHPTTEFDSQTIKSSATQRLAGLPALLRILQSIPQQITHLSG